MLTSLLSAQNVPFKKRKFRKQKQRFVEIQAKLAKADELYFKKKYEAALDLFLVAHEFNPKNAILNYKIGDIYLRRLDHSKAISHLRKAYQFDRKIDKILFTDLIFDVLPETSIYCKIAHSYALAYDWDQAAKYYRLFKSTLQKNKELRYTFPEAYLEAFCAQKLSSCKSGENLTNHPLEVEIRNFGKEVNSEFEEHSPFLTADEKTLYFTARTPEGLGNDSKASLDDYSEDVYKAELFGNRWDDVENIGPPINSNAHDATASLSFDGRTLVIYRFNHENGGDLFYSNFEEGEWSELEAFPKTINTIFHESSACFSPDMRLMFFVSDKPGGMGGRDIYYSKRLRSGKWGRAYNMGPEVNTPFDEDGVFMHSDGRTLYFSSKGHTSMGGYDIFKTTFRNRMWSLPENLGYPINTPGDDIYFVISADGKRGYYASQRKGGEGFKDIYSIEFPEEKPPGNAVMVVNGKLIDEEGKGLKGNINVINNATQDTVGEYVSKEKDGSYILPLEKGYNYGVTVEVDGHLFYSDNVDLTDESGALNFQAVDKVIRLNKIKIGSRMVLRNIFFESGKVYLLESSMPEFKRLVGFMNKHPKLMIEVIGHTDNIGDQQYNQKLSESRAKFLVDRLIKYGVSEDRLTWKGYGMDKPIASNDTEEGRKKNRRIEFKVIRK